MRVPKLTLKHSINNAQQRELD